jgi:polyribonucleotide nucleotidyltransferase
VVYTMVQKFRFDTYDYEVELGKFARQADGAVWFKNGGTVVLATVVSAISKDFPGFLPLHVEYREKFSAAGKIPGGYFKREGKSTDREVLIARLIDRALRPMFPANFFDQVQILITVYSVDKEHTPTNAAFLASSLALSISRIPFMGPVGVVEVGRVAGQWIMNPTYPQTVQSDVRLVIAGTQEGICMVEGSANELSEQEFVDVLFKAHEEVKKVVAWQEEIKRAWNVTKDAVTDTYNWYTWQDRVDQFLTEDHVKKMYIEDKVERNTYLDSMRDAFIEKYEQEITTAAIPASVLSYLFDSVLKDKLTEEVFTLNKRVDGRAHTTVRAISAEIGLLPYAHGSAVFTRGRTQALASITLGSGEDAQKTETLMEAKTNGTFMLHYNFPPFSTGEVKPVRAPGRREVGHGHLAASAFDYLLPTQDEFPYTIRIVADILESDGSSSMATVCSSTMGLLQAGVPIRSMVSGIAMGLLKSKQGAFKVLSDISGLEDAFGLMDFKVVGTEKGITAIQMDIKYKGGLGREVFDTALDQARTGRLHILGEMKKVISTPHELSELVPKVTMIKINNDKIGAIIGTGGKTIREITETTRTQIDIEPDGMVKIFGGPDADVQGAIRWVKTLAGQITKGDIYQGKVRKLVDFGMFVELVPGQDGLVHISNIPRDLQRTYMRDFKLDDQVQVEVLDSDEVTGRISLRLITSK